MTHYMNNSYPANKKLPAFSSAYLSSFLQSLVAVLGMPLVGFLSFLIAVLILMIAFYFIFPKLNVEYEYMILNHDLQIDAIYNKSKRKHMLSFDIQSAEIIAPKKSPRLNAFHPDKTYDFTSGNENADVYAVMISLDQKNSCVYIEPDRKMIEHMRQWMGSKMFLD